MKISLPLVGLNIPNDGTPQFNAEFADDKGNTIQISQNQLLDSSLVVGKTYDFEIDQIIPVTGITLSPSGGGIRLEVGATLQLSTSVLPSDATNRDINFFNNNPLVVSVDPYRVVTGLAVGDATLIAASVDGSFLATLSLSVVPAPVPGKIEDASTVELSQEPLTVSAPAEVAPAQVALEPEIVKSPETATTASSQTITVSTPTPPVPEEASSPLPEATVAISEVAAVAPAIILVTSIIASPNPINLTVGATRAISASVFPADASNLGLSAVSADPTIASIDASGVVTGIAPGIATLNIDSADGNATLAVPVVVSAAITATPLPEGAVAAPQVQA